MEKILFNIDKVISYKNRSKAELGKKYYFFDEITSDILCDNFSACQVGCLVEVNSSHRCYSFSNEISSYNFIYPYGNISENHLSYDELKRYWLENPTKLYRFHDEVSDVTGMIMWFDDKVKQLKIGNITISEEPLTKDDTWLIKNLTDVNGNSID